MNDVWDLNRIYTGFDSPAFRHDLEELKNITVQFAAFTATLPQVEPAPALAEGIALLERLTEVGGKLAQYATLRQAANTIDTEAGSQMGQILAIYSDVAGSEATFKDWVAKLPNLQALRHGDEMLRDYGFLLENIRDSSRYLLPGRGEEIMTRMQISGGNAWSDLHRYLTSTVPVIYRDSTINLSAVRNLANSADSAVRKDAFQAELACYEQIKAPVAYALNSIKLETLSDCALRGYGSPLERTLKDAHMTRATLDAMLGAMDEYLPKFWQYLKTKATVLGHKGGLPWYDLFAPMGASSTQFTAETARDYLVELFSSFDSEIAAMIRRAFDEAWIDFYPRSGKQGGAFCADVESIGQSRILTNFDGTFSSIVTLAHELGHAFHNECIRSHRPLNHDYSMPLAETASTFNECVVMASAIQKAANDQERIALIESQLQDATQIICDIYSRYRFETAVFENREAQFMDADTLCGLMLEAQKQCYGDGMDQNCLHPYMWICKSHYYGPTFYNFPYAFGGLFARGLYAQYEKEGATFLPKYKQLLHATTVATAATAEDTAKVAGIDLTDKAFWRSALQTIANQIDLFCSLTQT